MPELKAKANKAILKRVGLTLFFCLLTSLAFAANSPPQVGTVTPSSGSSQAEQTIAFTTTYIDPDGWQNIRFTYLLINTAAINNNCFLGLYSPDSNKFYLRNDANTAWIGGFTVGSANSIENSYVKLDCLKSSTSGSVTTLTVRWAITFKSTFIGTKNTYLRAIDYSRADSNWIQRGTWTISPADTTAPTGTIKINNDDLYCRISSVTLYLSASDDKSGIDKMCFSNNGIDWTTPQSYYSYIKWKLTPGDGKKIVYVKFCDKAGNWSQAYSAKIILDTKPPYFEVNPVIKVNNSKIQVLAGDKEYYSSIFINDKEVIPTNKYNTWYYDYPLSDTNSQISITAFDRAGNIAQKTLIDLNRVINLNTEPPVITGLRIDPQTRDLIITIKDPAKVLSYNIYYANSLTATGQTEPFRLAQANYPVSGKGITEWRDNGTYTQVHPADPQVRMRYYKLEIARIDTTPPQGTLKINDDAIYTNSTTITLTLSAQDAGSALAQMQFSNDNINWSTPEAYATTKTWTLTSGDGTKTVYAKFKDIAGNWSNACSDTIILQTKLSRPATTNGRNFIFDGKKFFFVGLNCYYLMVHATSSTGRRPTVDEAFDDAQAMGVTVIRTWAFNDGNRWMALQTQPGVYDEEVFQGLDYVVAEAAKHNIKLILTFTDYWSWYGGMSAYVSWDQRYGTDGHTSQNVTDFYTDSDIQKWLKTHINKVLNRVNTITRIKYKNDPTIFAWELCNEPRSSPANREDMHNWIIEMSSYIKSIDSNHMVTIGLEGMYNKDYTNWRRNGSEGDFLYDSSIEQIDFTTVHVWPDIWGMSYEETLSWVREHIEDSHNILHKPIIIEELGKLRDSPGGPTTIRDTWFQAVFDEAINQKAAGVIPWALYHDTYPDYDGYGIYYPADASTCAIISQAAGRMKDLSSTDVDFIQINGGATHTSSVNVTIDVLDKGIAEGFTEMQFSSDGQNWTVPQPYAVISIPWTLSSGDGRKIVFARFKKQDIWLSPVYDTIILDTIGPKLSKTIPSDLSKFCETDTVTLSQEINDFTFDKLEYQYSYQGLILQPWSENRECNWQVPTNNFGLKKMKFEVRDGFNRADAKEIDVFVLKKPLIP